MTYYRITRQGKRSIDLFLSDCALPNIDNTNYYGMAEAIRLQMDEGHDCNLEIRPNFSVDKKPHTLQLSRHWFVASAYWL